MCINAGQSRAYDRTAVVALGRIACRPTIFSSLLHPRSSSKWIPDYISRIDSLYILYVYILYWTYCTVHTGHGQTYNRYILSRWIFPKPLCYHLPHLLNLKQPAWWSSNIEIRLGGGGGGGGETIEVKSVSILLCARRLYRCRQSERERERTKEETT